MTRVLLALALLASVAHCAGGAPSAVAIDPRSDTCAWCRMVISDARFAAEIVAPAEEPKLFDDIGCLRDYLASGAALPPGMVIFVADHRTRAFVVASRAVYRHLPGAATPMTSGLAAWADESSCSIDPDARAGTRRTLTEIFRSTGPRRTDP